MVLMLGPVFQPLKGLVLKYLHVLGYMFLKFLIICSCREFMVLEEEWEPE